MDFAILLVIGSTFSSVVSEGCFIQQPGDVNLAAVPGFPSSEYIPCILNKSTYRSVGWEQKTTTNNNISLISSNRQIYTPYQNNYEFKINNRLDYSLMLKTTPSNGAQLRCYIVGQQPCHSSWSNITYTVPPLPEFPHCHVSSNSVRAGENVTLTCVSRGADPEAILTWFNGTSNKHLDKGLPRHEAGLEITITVSKYDNNQPFHCLAENTATKVLEHKRNCTVRVGVMYEPSIAYFSTDTQPVIERASFTIKCQVDGNPPSTLLIFNESGKSSDKLVGDTGLNEISYTIQSPECPEMFQFKCVAQNNMGGAIEDASFQTWCAPRCQTAPSITPTRTRGEVLVTTEVIAYPTPNITCHFITETGSSKEINNTRYYLQPEVIQGTYSVNLLLGAPQTKHMKSCSCALANAVGSTDIDFQVIMLHSNEGTDTPLFLAVTGGFSVVLVAVLFVVLTWVYCRRKGKRNSEIIEMNDFSIGGIQEPPTAAVEQTSSASQEEIPITQDRESQAAGHLRTSCDSEYESMSTNSSHSYNRPNPHYVNEHMVKPVYAYLAHEENERSSRHNLDYEDVDAAGYEVPVSSQNN